MFPEATPTVNVSEYEAKAAEDTPAASAAEPQETREEEEERVATPLPTKKMFSRRMCRTLQLLKWRLKILRQPRTTLLKLMILSWLKLMWLLQ